MNPEITSSQASVALAPSTTEILRTYRSGTAARLSGVPVETLRVWERRYELVNPRRSEHGHREYSIEEIRHLSLIKQLVDRGNPIGAIAHLPLTELNAMLNQDYFSTQSGASTGDKAAASEISVVIVAERMAGCLIGVERNSTLIRVRQHYVNLSRAKDALPAQSADLLVLEMSEIDRIDIQEVDSLRQQINAVGGVILYRFARHEAVRKLRSAGFVVARMPSDAKELEALCHLAMAPNTAVLSKPPRPSDVLPERMFDDVALASISESANSVYCECPRHLVDILHMLGSFERYSSQCENRSDQDELLHRDIHHATAYARSIIEGALEKVVRAEGLVLR